MVDSDTETSNSGLNCNYNSMSSSSSDSDNSDDAVSAVEDEGNNEWIGETSVAKCVLELVDHHQCSKKCFKDKNNVLGNFLSSYKRMTKKGKWTCLLTTLAASSGLVGTQRQRGAGNRN